MKVSHAYLNNNFQNIYYTLLNSHMLRIKYYVQSEIMRYYHCILDISEILHL